MEDEFIFHHGGGGDGNAFKEWFRSCPTCCFCRNLPSSPIIVKIRMRFDDEKRGKEGRRQTPANPLHNSIYVRHNDICITFSLHDHLSYVCTRRLFIIAGRLY